jgi:hypothetical protein
MWGPISAPAAMRNWSSIYSMIGGLQMATCSQQKSSRRGKDCEQNFREPTGGCECN